jgi:uncharacterized protein (TIGR02246 family)
MLATHTTDRLDAVPAAIVATFERLEQAWNRGDGAGFGAEFTDDVDFVDIRGTHHRGSVAVAAGHQAIFDTIYHGSTVRYVVETTRPLRAGAVVTVVGARLDVPAGPMAGHLCARLTATFVEHDDRWAITTFHNTLVHSDN